MYAYSHTHTLLVLGLIAFCTQMQIQRIYLLANLYKRKSKCKATSSQNVMFMFWLVLRFIDVRVYTNTAHTTSLHKTILIQWLNSGDMMMHIQIINLSGIDVCCTCTEWVLSSSTSSIIPLGKFVSDIEHVFNQVVWFFNYRFLLRTICYDFTPYANTCQNWRQTNQQPSTAAL